MTGQRALHSGKHELSGDQDWLSLYYDVSKDFSSFLFPSGRRPAMRRDEFNSVARASLRGHLLDGTEVQGLCPVEMSTRQPAICREQV